MVRVPHADHAAVNVILDSYMHRKHLTNKRPLICLNPKCN